MAIRYRWLEQDRKLAIQITDRDNESIGETVQLVGDLSDRQAIRPLVEREIAESCARTGAKP